jgi:hypothetical protein
LAEEVDFFDGSDAGGGEPALFIELTRVRQVGFGDDAEDLAARDEGSGVKETSRDLKGQPYEGGEAEASRGLGD